MNFTQRLSLGVWLLTVVCALGFYLRYPEFFVGENLANFLQTFTGYILLIYIVLGIIRAFTFIPAAVHVFLGVALFPNNLWFAFFASLLCIMISGGIIYKFSDFLGLDIYFKKKYPKHIKWLEEKLDKYGIGIVAAWSVFPIVPTDLISYVAGTFNMNINKFLLGLFLGEVPIVVFYIFLGDWVAKTF